MGTLGECSWETAGVYRVTAFEIADPDEAFSLVEARVAGTLVVPSGDGMEASLLPWRLLRGPPGRRAWSRHRSTRPSRRG